MICHPDAIRGRLSNAGYKCCHEGTSDSYNKQRCTLVQCTVCTQDLTARSLQAHMHRVHGRDASGAMMVTPPAEVPCTYKLNFTFRSENSQKIVDCPVRDCLYQAATAANLCRHFFNWHHSHSLHLLEDRHVPSFCTLCGMSVLPIPLSQNHKGLKMC